MDPAFIAHQVVRLAKAFPKVAQRLDDLEPIPDEYKDFLEDDVIQSLSKTSSRLISENIMHVIRVESIKQPDNFTRSELKDLENRLVSLVDFLIARPELRLLNDQYSECESVFITLYTILSALEKDDEKLNRIFDNYIFTTPLLFAKAAELSNNGLSATGNDNPYNQRAHYELYTQLFTGNQYTLRQWEMMTIHILATLDLVVIADKNTLPNLDVEETKTDVLMSHAKYGRLSTIQNFMRQDESDYKTIFLKNASAILLIASENERFNTVNYLLTLYEDNIATHSLNPVADLGTPLDKYSLLAWALFYGKTDTVMTLIRLQKAPLFKPMDRNLISFFTKAEWNSEELRNNKKSSVGKTLLHMAAQHNQAPLIKPLIEQAGIKLNDKTYYTELTALQVAELLKKDDAAKILRELTIPPVTGQKNQYNNDNDEGGQEKKKIKIC